MVRIPETANHHTPAARATFGTRQDPVSAVTIQTAAAIATVMMMDSSAPWSPRPSPSATPLATMTPFTAKKKAARSDRASPVNVVSEWGKAP